MTIKQTHKIVLIAFSFLFIANCSDKSPLTKVLAKHANGQKKVVATYLADDDTTTYLREFYFDNGQIGSKGNIKKSKLDGPWTWWFENGTLKDEALLHDGQYYGQRKHWRKDGTLEKIEILEKECVDECCDGKVIFYDAKGLKQIEYSYKNGTRHGEAILFFKDGSVCRQFTYLDGKKSGLSKDYFKNGKVRAQGLYDNDLEEGAWTFYDTTGKFLGQRTYIRGVRK